MTMKIPKDATLIPVQENIIVSLDFQTKDMENAFWTSNDTMAYVNEHGIMLHKGIITAISANEEYIKIDDKIMFNSLSGSHLVTEGLTKVIPRRDALIRMKDMNNTDVENFEPLFDRLLVEVIDNKTDEVFQSSESEKEDPRFTSMTYAKVIAVGDETTGIVEVGDIIGMEYHVGEMIRQKGINESQLRAVSELYVSVIIK